MNYMGPEATASDTPCDVCGRYYRWSPLNPLCATINCTGTTQPQDPHNRPLRERVPERSPHQNVMLGLPEDPAERKKTPILSGVLDYFPAAMAEVARVSLDGNEQHNPGQPLHWARGKSSDQGDCIVRHLLQRGTFDERGMRHSARLAWRALALLQEELEADAGFVAEEVHQEWTQEREEGLAREMGYQRAKEAIERRNGGDL